MRRTEPRPRLVVAIAVVAAVLLAVPFVGLLIAAPWSTLLDRLTSDVVVPVDAHHHPPAWHIESGLVVTLGQQIVVDAAKPDRPVTLPNRAAREPEILEDHPRPERQAVL